MTPSRNEWEEWTLVCDRLTPPLNTTLGGVQHCSMVFNIIQNHGRYQIMRTEGGLLRLTMRQRDGKNL